MEVKATRTVIQVAPYDATYDFYKNVLQFPIFTEYKLPSGLRACAFGSASWGIEIIEDPNAAADDGRARASMEVADVFALREELAGRTSGIPEVEDRGWSNAFLVTAPDGYRTLFFTRK